MKVKKWPCRSSENIDCGNISWLRNLHFGWEEVHEMAEELEHISSKKLIDRLDEFLGFPKTDPHGDPIPDSAGKLSMKQQVSLRIHR